MSGASGRRSGSGERDDRRGRGGDRARGDDRGRGSDRSRGGRSGGREDRPRSGGGPRNGDRPRSGGGRPRGGGEHPPRARSGSRAGAAPGERRPARERLRSADGPRLAAHETLRAVADRDAYANLVLPGLLRRQRITGRDAAFATELTYGTLRMQGLYDAVLATVVDRPLVSLDPAVLDTLRLGAHQLLGMRVPDHAAVAATVGLARTTSGPGAGGLVNAVLRRVAERDLDAWRESVAPDASAGDAGLAVRHSHPEWVVRALRQALLGHGRDAGELEALLEADNAPADVSLLARPGLVDVAELLADGGRPGRWSPLAVTMASGSPGGLRAIRAARARVQDEGSQLVALALAAAGEARDSEHWLDLCAGPGGKSALLSALAAQRGHRGVAVESSHHRAELTRQAVAGAEEAWQVREADARDVGAEEPGQYDRVLVDVPCTGLGALRRRPEARWRRQPADLAALAPLQRALLASAITATRPGGVVAYVTCSPHLAETRTVVEDGVRRAGSDGVGVELLDAREALGEGAGREIDELGDGPTVQLWPHVHGTDAMFLALLRRTT